MTKVRKQIVDKYGTIRYYNEKAEYHREDGPAVDYATGDKVWFVNGEQHREDGPAVEYADGSKEWWINGKELTEEEITALEKRLTMKKALGIL